MKIKTFSLLTIILLLAMAAFPLAALAGAYEVQFTTSITYQNVDTSATTDLRIFFYDSPSDTVPIEIIRPNLAAGAGTSVFIGGLAQIGPSFEGTAVMTSDRNLVATLVQIPDTTQTTVKVRPLSNGFSSGTPNSLIATVLKNAFSPANFTVFSVQNVGSSSTDVTITFYNTSAAVVHTINQTLQPGAGYFVDAGTITQLGSTFNGSVVIQSTGGSIVSSAMEMETGSGVGAKAFEGLGAGATTIFMPSALCNYVAAGGPTNTAYAVQNTSLSTSTNVTVTYSNGTTQSSPIGPGAKASFVSCNASGMTQNFLGAATITSDTTDVIAIGKAYGQGLSTAFVGASSGSQRIALPYVRYSTNANFLSGAQQRVFISIQNVGGSTVTGDIVVRYIDRDGVEVGTHTITTDVAPGAKVNSNATNAGLAEFGVYNAGTQFGGGVIIEGPAGSELAAIARVQTYVPATGLSAAEDYNGIPQ